ncbi:hypothetical protein [Paenibacillus kribbensis]|uniref:hypothetical protein n=1 Tax=Paenibacillus kribbensis TaxID=172713 RepID=UPI000837F325|nr:hypothetical protein [Paenibacillus kribbensis]
MYTPIKLNKIGVNRWFAFSKKLNREVTFYGELEYDHWVLIEMDPEVTNYCEKPFEINHSYFDKSDKAMIDMWVRRKNSEEFVNITHTDKIDPHNGNFSISVIEKINAVKLWAQFNKHKHIIATEKEIYSNRILLENKKRLLPYNFDISSINMELKNRIINQIQEGVNNIMDLETQLSENSNIYEFQKTLYILIIQQLVSSNIDQKPLGPETEVYLR